MVVLTKLVLMVPDCIRKKPGERSAVCVGTGVGAGSTGWGGVGTRGMGYGDTVRTLVVPRGTGPGPASHCVPTVSPLGHPQSL